MPDYKPPWETDPISYLVEARFPGVEKTRRARRAGGYMAPNAGTRETEQAAEVYRFQLSELPQSELAKRVQELQLSQAKALAAKREVEEAARFFNLPHTNANYSYWAKMAYWTIDEGVALSLGKNPQMVNWKEVSPYLSVSAFAARYAAKRELALRAETMGQIWSSTIPTLFLAWAERIGFEVPIELGEAVTALGFQIADWKKLYDEQVKRTVRAEEETTSAHRQYLNEVERHDEFLAVLRREQAEICAGYERRIAELENAANSAPEKPVSARERDSLLELVIAMAVKGYSYNPRGGRSPTAGEIAGDLSELGLSLDADTIRKYLNEAKDLLPQIDAE